MTPEHQTAALSDVASGFWSAEVTPYLVEALDGALPVVVFVGPSGLGKTALVDIPPEGYDE